MQDKEIMVILAGMKADITYIKGRIDTLEKTRDDVENLRITQAQQGERISNFALLNGGVALVLSAIATFLGKRVP